VSRPRTPHAEFRVGLLLLAALGIFAWLSIQVGGGFSLFSTKLEVKAVFDDAAGLVADSAVKVAGVGVGAVRELSVEADRAVAVLSLNPDAGIRSDVRAEIRARSLLGEKYIALVPVSGDAPLLVAGDEITNTVPALEINQVITQLGPLLNKIDPEDMAQIVKSLGEITSGLGEETPTLTRDLRELVSRLNEAAEVLPEVKEELPRLLSDLRRTTSKIEQLVEHSERMVTKTGNAADAVPVTARKANAAIDKANAAIDKVNSAIDKVSPGLDDLNRTMEQSDEALAKMMKVLDKADSFSEDSLRRLLREEGVLVRLIPQRKRD